MEFRFSFVDKKRRMQDSILELNQPLITTAFQYIYFYEDTNNGLTVTRMCNENAADFLLLPAFQPQYLGHIWLESYR